MNNYFENVKSVEELRKRYRELLKEHHPDNGGNEDTMKQINAEYDRLFAILSREKQSDRENTDYDEKAKNDENNAFKTVINAIISFNMKIELIGNWIWCFDCYAYKDRLKELGFKYAPKKKAWVWHYGEYKRHYKGEISLEDIRIRYGSKTVNNSKSRQYAIN